MLQACAMHHKSYATDRKASVAPISVSGVPRLN